MCGAPADRSAGVAIIWGPVHDSIAQRTAPLRRRIDAALATEPHARLPVALQLALFVEILAVYAVTLVRMRRQDVRDVAARGWPGPARDRADLSGARVSAEQARVARRLGWAVTRTLMVLPTDSRCLVQSLVLKRLLATREIPSRLVIGARSDGPFMAHAWIECDSVAVLPARGYEDSRLVEL